MAIRFESHVVSDLCLGKPALKSISISSSIADALLALKSSDDDAFISIWTCDHHHRHNKPTDGDCEECRCVGKISMVDILCFLCKDDNLASPVSALHSPVSLILPKHSVLVNYVHPSTSVIEAMRLILQGAENLIVPIQSTDSVQEYCWLTQEDLIRFILSRIGQFSPTAAYTIEELGIIHTEISSVEYDSPATLALNLLTKTLNPVAVVDDEAEGAFIGEISASAFSGSDESTAAAIMALSCGDLMSYIDTWGGPPEYLIRAINSRLKDSDSRALLALLDDCQFSSDDEDSMSSSSSSLPLSPFGRLKRHHIRSGSYSSITCHPESSLVAVMIQAIAHRVNYVWVLDHNFGLAGIVTFSDMLQVFYEHINSMFEEEE